MLRNLNTVNVDFHAVMLMAMYGLFVLLPPPWTFRMVLCQQQPFPNFFDYNPTTPQSKNNYNGWNIPSLPPTLDSYQRRGPGNAFDPYNKDNNYLLDLIKKGIFNSTHPGYKLDYREEDGHLVKLPGILDKWRSDLQGKQRPESKQLQKDIFVTTTYGEVQGFNVYLYDNPLPESGFRLDQTTVEKIQASVEVFLGIPYASPPVFDARFKPPRAHPNWQKWYAVNYGPICPQSYKSVQTAKDTFEMDENCLYLNIFSPSTKAGIGKLFPVMVYIHGGDFTSGSGNLFPGHIMAAFYDVVVVTFNYRLGALGFLSTGDHNSPGNYGLLDQCMALRWIYDNIEFFNGDKQSITLFGPDAGAASAGLLMVNPRTRHIVSKVIAQSGSAVADWALIQDRWRAQNTSKVFAQKLGCSIDSSWKLVDCLKNSRSFMDLGNTDFKPQVGIMPWGPVLDLNFTMPANDWYEGWFQHDWYFINETVQSSIKARKYHPNLAYMSGITTQETSYILANNKSMEPHFEVTDKFMEEKIRELVLQYNYTLNAKGVFEALKFMYTYWPDPDCMHCKRTQYVNMLSDFLYVAPHDKITKLLLRQKVPVYMYVDNTTVESFHLPEWDKVPHNIELPFLFGAPFLDTEMLPLKMKIEKRRWTYNDRNMSHFFMKAFTNFAKYGNPTYTQILGMHFEEATSSELKYLNINTTFNSSIMLNYRQMECAFWSHYLPTVVGNFVPLYPPYFDYWWQAWQQYTPIHIAFWSMSAMCMMLLAVTVIFCMLYVNSRRDPAHYYDDEFMHFNDEKELTEAVGAERRENDSINHNRFYEPPLKSTKSVLTVMPSNYETPSAIKPAALHYAPKIDVKTTTIATTPGKDFKQSTELKNGIPQTAV